MTIYHSLVRGVWPFSGNLEDEVHNNSFSMPGYVASYQQYQRYNLSTGGITSRYGLTLEENQYLVANNVSLADGSGNRNFNISFWWYSPGAVGYIRHAITRNLTTKVVPILSQAETSVVDNQELVNDGTGEIIISEIAASSTQNAVQVELCVGSNAPTYRYISSSYNPGLRHVFINYATSNSDALVKIFVNGELAEYRGPTAAFSPTSSNLYINKIFHGYSSHKYCHTGAHISDLVIRGGSDNNDEDANKSFKFGWESITDTAQYDDLYAYLGVGYQQPSTVTTSQIYSEGGSIIVSRSNGDILKGHRPIWANEFKYRNEVDVNLLNASDPSKVERLSTGSGIKILGTTVRI